MKNYFTKTLRKTALFCAAAPLFACASLSGGKAALYGGLGAGSDPVPLMPAARVGTLPNGLRYYILENARPEGRAYLTLAVHAGSVLERDDEQGLAHFVEHMAFNGTERFPESELVDYLRSLGMRFGPEANAYTTYDKTVYGIEVPVEKAGDHKRIPVKALEVIDDWTHAITFAPRDVDDERSVIMEEYRSNLGAMERFRRRVLPVLFQGSPYANRHPIGLPEIIQNAPAERLENFYRTWYRPDNMALILVGDFDGAALEAELASRMSAPAPAGALKRPAPDLPKPKKGNVRAEIFTDPELTSVSLSLYFKRAPGAGRADLAAFRGDLVDALIDRMLAIRFSEAAFRPETPYVDAGAGTVRYGTSSRFYVMSAGAKAGAAMEDAARETLRELLREKEYMTRYGFSAAELERAKASLLSGLIQEEAERDRQNSGYYVQLFTNHFIDGAYAADISWELKAAEALLPLIRGDDINRAVKDYFGGGELTLFVSGPESEAPSLPGLAELKQFMAELERAPLDPPGDGELSGELIEDDPVPGFIAAESVDEATGALVWELSNGVRLILKETANKNNQAALYALARGGITSASDTAAVSASLAAEMLSASGAGPYSRPNLIKKLADKQVSFSFWTSHYYRGFQGSAATGDLKTLFELIYLTFTQPRIDADAVKVLLDQYRTALALQDEDPETAFSNEITKTIYANHPRFKPLEQRDLGRVSIDDARAFLGRALNPADYTFVLTGNLDLEVLRLCAETYLASIAPGDSWNNWQNLHISRPSNVGKSVFKGREEKALVFLGWYSPTPYSEEAQASALALSEYLDIVLTKAIRETMGGVYSISAGISLSPIPEGELTGGVYFACDPRRAGELVTAVTEQMQRVTERVDPDTFTKAVEALKKSYESSLESNNYIAQSYANSAALLNLPLSRLDKRGKLYEAVTSAAMQETARRLLRNLPIQVILYPEGWHTNMGSSN